MEKDAQVETEQSKEFLRDRRFRYPKIEGETARDRKNRLHYEWVGSNREKNNEYHRRWYAKHPERRAYYAELKRKERAKKKAEASSK